MDSLEAELERAKALDVDELASSIQAIGFECTRCGGCCKGETDDPHTATVFPDEIRTITEQEPDYDWRDVARPMPFGLDDEGTGETFEWALATEECGDCTFYEEADDGTGACGIHGDHPLICQTYPFSVGSAADDQDGGLGTTEPMGGVVEQHGMVRAHECEGLGRDISRADAEAMARTLKERAIRELEEAIAVRTHYTPVDPDPGEVIVHDSEGQKSADGTPRDGVEHS
ncbi:MAG: YkgJ family cysteine cluster protein [Halobacteriales archaeon]